MLRCLADRGADWCHTVCGKDCFPESEFCLEHTDKEILAMLIQAKDREFERLEEENEGLRVDVGWYKEAWNDT
jgi:hypothetical protein